MQHTPQALSVDETNRSINIMEYFLTSAVAAQLGCSDQQIRTLKSRNKDRLIEGTHWTKSEDKRTLWSPEGIEVLRQLITPCTQPLQADTQPLQVDDLLQGTADSIALHLIESRLPSLVHASLNRILTNPTDRDAQRLAEMFDRIGCGLGLMHLSSALAGGLRVALDASRESLAAAGLPAPAKQLEAGSNEPR